MQAFKKKYGTSGFDGIEWTSINNKSDAEERKEMLEKILREVDEQVASAMADCTKGGLDWTKDEDEFADGGAAEDDAADSDDEGASKTAVPQKKLDGWAERKAKYVRYVAKADKAWTKAEKHRVKAGKAANDKDRTYETQQQEMYLAKRDEYIAKLKKTLSHEKKKAEKAKEGHYKDKPFFAAYLLYKESKVLYTRALIEAVELMKKSRGDNTLGLDEDFYNISIV